MSFIASKPVRIGLIIVACVALLLAGGLFALSAAFPPERLAAMLGEQVKRVTGRDFHVRGQLSWRLFPDLAVVAEDVALGNAEWGSRAEMLTVRRVALKFALRPLLEGRVRIIDVSIEGADALFESSGDRRNWIFHGPDPTTGEHSSGTMDIDPDRIIFSGTRLAVRDGNTGEGHALQVEQLLLEARGDQAHWSGIFVLAGRQWQINGQTGRLATLLGEATEWPFDLQASTGGARLAGAGTLGLGESSGNFRAAVSARISAPEILGARSGQRIPLPMPVELDGNLVRTAEALTLDSLRAVIAGQTLSGRLTLLAGKGESRLEGRLSSPLIDIGQWVVGQASVSSAMAGKAKQNILFDDKPLLFGALPAFPMDLQIRVDRLLLPGFQTLSAFHGHVLAGPGRFQFEGSSAMAGEGKVEGVLDIRRDSARPQTDLRLLAKGLSVDSLKALSRGGSGFHGGQADFKADLTLLGEAPSQLAASASGEIVFGVQNTTLAGKAAALERSPLETVVQTMLPDKASQQRLPIRCVVVRLPLRQGMAHVDRSIAMDMEQLSITASGEVDLVRQNLTLVFQPQVKKGFGLTQSSLVQMVMLKGSLQAPRVAIDPKGIAVEAATLGVAVATGGLSLVAERFVNKRDAVDVCRQARTGVKSRPSTVKTTQRKLLGSP